MHLCEWCWRSQLWLFSLVGHVMAVRFIEAGTDGSMSLDMSFDGHHRPWNLC